MSCRTTALSLLWLSSACQGAAGVDLFVDLQTDFVAAEEFTEVEVIVGRAVEPGDELYARVPVEPGDDFLDGRRIGEFRALAAGASYRATVRLRAASGALVAEQRAVIDLRSDFAATLQISRGCRGVVCPLPEGDASHTQCLGGACTPPTCTFEQADADACAAVCETAADCPDRSDCSTAVCSGGDCFYAADDSACDSGICDVDSGCQLDCGECDDGNVCTEDICTRTGCRHVPDLASCDDGNPCTVDSCDETGCVNIADDRLCDDGNPCTEDLCRPGGCVRTPRDGEECDDGTFCNGVDTCAEGSCTVHSGNPCAMGSCIEADATCGCAGPEDCPSPSTLWDACSGFADECATDGRRDGVRTEWTCNTTTARCESATSMVTNRPCSRVTDDLECDDGDRCNGTERCAAGACTVPGRALREGDNCGRTARDRCCGGVCVDVQVNADHCGSCGVSCPTGVCRRTRLGSPAEYTGACGDCDVPTNTGCPSGGWLCRNVGAETMCHCQMDNSLCAPFGYCLDTGSFHACAPS